MPTIKRSITTLALAGLLLLILPILYFSFVTPLSAELILDGSFEDIPSTWTETGDTDCLPRIGDWSSLPGFPEAYDGSQYFWAGDWCSAPYPKIQSNRVEKEINVSANDTHLSFWYYAYKEAEIRPAPNDFASVEVNGIEVWRLYMRVQNNTSTWTNVVIDISEFAGQTVPISFGVQHDLDIDFGHVLFDFVELRHPEVSISKTAATPFWAPGTAVTFTITISNSGDIPLSDIEVSDLLTPDCDRSAGELTDLDVGESVTYQCVLPSVAANLTNTAVVTATASSEHIVTASDTATITVVDSQISVSISPYTQTVTYGEAALFTITVSNGSAVTVEDIIVATPSVPDCNRVFGDIAAFSNITYNCSLDEVFEDLVNEVTVNGITANTQQQSLMHSAVALVQVISQPITYAMYLPTVLNKYVKHDAMAEPNNICDIAYPLVNNHMYHFMAEDVNDWYQFELTETSNLSVELTEFAPISGQIVVWKGSCDSAVFLGHNGDFSTTKVVILNDQPPGNYLIWLINDGPTNTNSAYTLRVHTFQD